MKLRDRIEGALGFGVMAAVVANVAYQLISTEVPPSLMIGFFLCAAIPTFLFTDET